MWVTSEVIVTGQVVVTGQGIASLMWTKVNVDAQQVVMVQRKERLTLVVTKAGKVCIPRNVGRRHGPRIQKVITTMDTVGSLHGRYAGEH